MHFWWIMMVSFSWKVAVALRPHSHRRTNHAAISSRETSGRGQSVSEDPGRQSHTLADRRGQLGRDGVGQPIESLGARRVTPSLHVARRRTSRKHQPPTWPGAGWAVNVERKGGL